MQNADAPADQVLFLIRPVLETRRALRGSGVVRDSPGRHCCPGTAASAEIAAAAGGATIVASLGPSVIVGEVNQVRGLFLGPRT